jgi:hypothetical protein
MKEIKACGAENLPSKDWDRNSASTSPLWPPP